MGREVDVATHYYRAVNTRPRKPTVLLDCDGPLADFIAAVLDIVHDETGNRYKPEDVKTWEIFESIESKEVGDRVYAKIKDRGGCYGIAVQQGAAEAVRELKKHAEVVILTSPFYGSETWAYEREKWLYDHFGIKSYEVIHARDKYHVAGDFLVDDKASHIRQWQLRFPDGDGLLWTMNYNQNEDLRRIHSWKELLDLVLE